MRQKITQLQDMARDMVGDSGTPNLFFVTEEGVVTTVTRNLDLARQAWRLLPRNRESAIEDRQTGVLCSVEQGEDGRWFAYDDTELWKRLRRARSA